MVRKKSVKIPFCPLPFKTAERLSARFRWFAEKLSAVSPSLDLTLRQARIPVDSITYLSVSAFSAAFISSLVFVVLLLVSSRIVEPVKAGLISISFGIIMFFVVLVYTISYPRFNVKKRVAGVERSLMFALKHMLIQIKSGVPIYDSLVSISEGNYGVLSEEFTDLVKDVNAGTSINDALNELALRNPSTNLRRVVWQISNGIKAGSDMGGVIDEVIATMSKEKMLAIRKYGSELNPLTLVYMMIAVIIPALGVTMLIVLSSFSGIAISETIFLGILALAAFLQFMYMGLIKSRRPNI